MREGKHAIRAIKLYMRYHTLAGLQKTRKDFNLDGAEVLERSSTGVDRKVDRMIDGYINNKEALDAAAFKVLDVKKNGRIELDELIAGLTVGDKRFAAFTRSLGFSIESLESTLDSNRYSR